MYRPLCLVSALAGAFLSGAVATAEEEAPPKTAVKEATASAPARAAAPLISSMIAAGLPKYTPSAAKAMEGTPVSPDGSGPPIAEGLGGRIETNATIIHLPAMIVRDRKLPKESEILTDKEKARRGMDTYIGPEDGLDRGVLNLFTPVATLWQHLPFFGHYQLVDFETNEQRGLRLYQAAERRQELEDLNLLKTVGQKADGASEPKASSH